MARAMPLSSISRPRNTNNGTDSRMMWLMPSSMRETTTVRGVLVVSARNANVARPKENTIGAPESTSVPTSSTKKTMRR